MLTNAPSTLFHNFYSASHLLFRYESAVLQWEATWDEYVAINDEVCTYANDFNTVFYPTYVNVITSMENYLLQIESNANQIVSAQRCYLVPYLDTLFVLYCLISIFRLHTRAHTHTQAHAHTPARPLVAPARTLSDTEPPLTCRV